MMTLMIASAAVGAVGAVAGAATGIAGGIQSYNQQKENAKAQQNMLEYNARLERREAEAGAARLYRRTATGCTSFARRYTAVPRETTR